MKKRILCLILTLGMMSGIIGGFPAVTHAAANIEIGDYVQMGTYYGEPILWRCVDIDDNGPLMLSDKIISIKPYDAKGSNTSGSHGRGYNGGSYRVRFGSNYWADSNMRSWLNSEAGAGNVNWLCGNPPDESHVDDGNNEYADEAGFLSNFTQSEKNAIKTVTQKSLLHKYEDGSYHSNYHDYSSSISSVVQNYDRAYCEYVTDRMFLLDVKQVNAVYNNRGVLGSSYYIGQPTAKAVENSEYKSSSLATGKNWYYRLRSPNADGYYDDSVRCVDSDGYVSNRDAHTDFVGVRPAFYLNLSSAKISGGAGTENSPYTVVGGSKGSYNDRGTMSESVSLTIMKNNKDMTDSADEYVEYATEYFPFGEKTDYELEGYYKEQIDTSKLSYGDKIYLEKSGMNVPIVRGVYLGGKDVRREELVIKSDFTGQLTAEIDWNGQKEKIAYIDNGITQLKLTNGKTEEGVNWANFVYNARDIHIVLKTINGYTTKKKLNIKLLTNDNTPEEIELNIFDSITGIGSGVLPYLDDLSLSFDIPNFKLDFSVDPADNSIKGVFGVDVAEWAYENDLRDDEAGEWDNPKKQNAYKTISKLMKDTFKEMQKNKKDQKTLAQEYKKLTKQLGEAKQRTTAKFGFDAGIEVMGYVEGKVDHDGFYLSEGGIIVKASVAGSVSGEGVIWVIPYNWKLGGSAEANLNLQLAQAIRAQKLTPQGSVAITIGVNGEGGPGLEKVHLNLGIDGSFTPAWQFTPDSVFTLDGAFSIYFDAVAGPWSYKKDLFETSYRFYPRPKTVSLMSIDDVFNTNTYSLRERKYSYIPSEFVANDSGVMLFSFDEHKKEDKIIKTNSYDVSTPQYVELSDGRGLLVWLDDDTSRSVINGTSIMYSVNDGTQWSEPQYVESDGSGDYSPKLKTVGDEVCLVWEEIDIQPDDATMEESMKAMDIKYARFDSENNVFTDILQLTDDSYINSTPEIGISNGDVVVSWIKNTSSDMFTTDNVYSVEYAVISDGEVTESKSAVSGVSSIDSHIAESKDGVINVYYIYDTDGDLANVTDNVLKTTKNTLNVSGNVSGLCGFDDVVYYYNNGNIATDGEDIGVAVQNNNYCITDNGKAVIYTVQGDGMTADIYARFYDESQAQWGEAVRLTDLGVKVTDINGYSDENGKIHLAFNKKNLSQEGADSFYSTSDLAVMSIAPSYDLRIKDVYTENSNLIPGKAATLHVEVYNAGERTADVLEAVVYDNDGDILSSSEIDAKLLSGVTGEYDITYTLPEDFAPSEITVEVNVKGEEDYNTADNLMELMLDFNNLAISGINSVATEDGYSINAIVTNTGFAVEKDIEVSLLKENEVIETIVIASLGVLESETVTFAGVLADNEYIVKVSEKDNEDILVDNEEKITVKANFENHDTDGYVKELSYTDGKVIAEISMFNSYEESKAYLALYDSLGNLCGVAVRGVTAGEKSFDMIIEKELSDTENYTVKFMLWNSNGKPFMKTDVRELITQKSIVVDAVLESDHNYESNTNKTYTYTYDGNCESIDVKFTSDTQTESGYDYIYIYDGNDNQIGKYSGTALAGISVNIPGNTVKIKITSDGSVTRYGFKTESITVNR